MFRQLSPVADTLTATADTMRKCLLTWSALLLVAGCIRTGRSHFSGPGHPATGTYRLELVSTRSGEKTFTGWLVLLPERLPDPVRRQIDQAHPHDTGIHPRLADACFRWEIAPGSADSIPPTVVRLGLAKWTPTSRDSLLVNTYAVIDYFYSVNFERRPDGSLHGEAPFPAVRLARDPEPPRDRVVAVRTGDADPSRCVGP